MFIKYTLYNIVSDIITYYVHIVTKDLEPKGCILPKIIGLFPKLLLKS